MAFGQLKISATGFKIIPVALISFLCVSASLRDKKFLRKVIAPDMLGYGRSDKPLHGEYTIEYQAHILNELIERLSVREVELVAHDPGGPVGMLWAINNPNRVRKLVILNSLASAELNFRDRFNVDLMGLPGSDNIFATRSMLKYILKSHVYNLSN